MFELIFYPPHLKAMFYSGWLRWALWLWHWV